MQKNCYFRENSDLSGIVPFSRVIVSDIVFFIINGERETSMTAEIVDLGKYREEKKGNRNGTSRTTAETEPAKETSSRKPARARQNELREKDSGEKA